jgi:pimeloyl-ACP methyl ester carboxylesterase
MERVQLNGADIEYDVRGSVAPVVFIHGAIVSDGFVPVIEQAGIVENSQIVHYRRRGYAGSSRAPAGMMMRGWAGDCIALLNHLGIASAHVAGHSFGAGIALQMAIGGFQKSTRFDTVCEPRLAGQESRRRRHRSRRVLSRPAAV